MCFCRVLILLETLVWIKGKKLNAVHCVNHRTQKVLCFPNRTLSCFVCSSKLLFLTPCLLIQEFCLRFTQCLEYWSLVAKCTARQIIGNEQVHTFSEFFQNIYIYSNNCSFAFWSNSEHTQKWAT